MEPHLLKSAALVVVAVFGSACTDAKTGSGCGPDHEPGDRGFGDLTSVKSDRQSLNEPPSHPQTDSMPDVGTNVGSRPERPWAHNTGPSDPGALAPSGSFMVKTNGVVYENLDVTGDIWIDANNVTIRNFRINAAGEYYGINVLDGHGGIVLEDGEIYGMKSAGILGLGYTGRRLHIHDSYGDALKAQGTATGPTVIEYSFIEKLGTHPDAHADGNQTRGGSNITFRYNNIFLPSSGTPNYPGAPYKSNAAFMLELEISNFIIENNWLNGGSYTIYCYDDNAQVIVRNNFFGRDALYGLNAPQRPCKEWSGNVWEDTGDPI